MTKMDETRICYKCDYETNNPLGACPQCGHQLRTTAQVKRLGMLMAALGVALTLFIGGVAFVVAGIIWPPSNLNPSARFNGGPEILIFMFGIFAVAITFGLTTLLAGIFQIKYGRRNLKMVKVMLTLAFTLVVVGSLGPMFL